MGSLEDILVELIRRASTVAPRSLKDALQRELDRAEDPVARSQLETILRNIRLAEENSKPICQDTGILNFIFEIGEDHPTPRNLRLTVENAVKRATELIPLRPNAVDLYKGNTGNNVGLHVPWITVQLVPGDKMRICCFPKGGGSSNVAKLGMLNPGEGLKGVKRFVLESVLEAGPKGCPPYIVGVGVGGGEDIAMILAKKALLRPVGSWSSRPEVAKLERELLTLINRLGIGVMGLGSGPTALSVHVEVAARHPASLPVAVAFSCWALRYAWVEIDRDGEARFIE